MKGFVAAALTGMATAAAVGPNRVNANFDDIAVQTQGSSDQTIGNYKGLTYDGFNVINTGNSFLGIAPQSRPNVAVQTLITAGGDQTATLRPSSDDTTYFSFQSFYFGTVAATQETVASPPIAGSLTVTGRRNGMTVARQDISFFPQATLKQVTFDANFTNVDEVEFRQTGAASSGTAVLYDNLQYTLFTV